MKEFKTPVRVHGNLFPGSSGVENFITAQYFAREALTDLPSFGGGTREYAYWRESVVPLLNCDERGGIITFNSLLKLVKGEAKSLIAHVKPSSANPVKEAFDIWDTYYGQPSSMLQVLRKELVNLSKPNFSDAVQLGRFISLIKNTKEAYEASGLAVEGQYWFFEEVFSKFDDHHMERFCAKHRDPLGRTLKQLLHYLQDRFEVLCSKPGFAVRLDKSAPSGPGIKGAAAIVAKPEAQKKQDQKQSPPQGQEKKGDSGSKGGKRGRRSLPKYERDRPAKGVCPDCCQPGHGPVTCPQFLKRTPQERIYLIWLWFRCFSCLKPHSATGCSVPADYKCGEGGCTYKHHPLLHGSGSLYQAQVKYLPPDFLEKAGINAKGESRDKTGDRGSENI